jgi:DNA (cytosine-5)-methyltransferase 1
MRAVDLFAGAGGFSEGARAAGLNVVWAANHWQTAVEVHERNHPGTSHTCQDLQQADWTRVPPHDVLLASPACQGHSNARGKDRPHHDADRSTAWAVVECAEVHRPPFVVVENVVGLRSWILYRVWRLALEALGYSLSEQVLDAADTGVPQHRERLFVVGVQGKTALTIPAGLHTHVPVRDVLDMESGSWSAISRPGRSPNTLARIERGRLAFGRTFCFPYYGRGSGLTGRSLDRPLGTVTTRARWAVVDGDRMRMFTVPEYTRAMGFAPSYRLTGDVVTDIHLLGNAVPPPTAAHVLSHLRMAA